MLARALHSTTRRCVRDKYYSPPYSDLILRPRREWTRALTRHPSCPA
uniref:Uncharacterized protein n=1 Tax=Arundo donax TaxID=35708 RepID=A0A0A8YPE6_ARUDO